jgi:hypothetical protein
MFAFDAGAATAAAAVQTAAAADGAKLLLRGVTSRESSASAPAASPVNIRLPSWLSAKQLMGLLETCACISTATNNELRMNESTQRTCGCPAG